MSVPYEITIPPSAAEPISVSEAMIALRSDSDTAEEAAFVGRLITATRNFVEQQTHRMLLPQTWKLNRYYWPLHAFISLPTAPVNTIVNVSYKTATGVVTYATANYTLVTYHNRLPTLRLAEGTTWPITQLVYPGLEITFTCGYAVLPAPLREAMLSLITYWYDNREAAIASTQYKAEVVELPLRYKDLISDYILDL